MEHPLGEMLGEEEVALVIIDPREMPRNWTEIWAAENIGECFPRLGGDAGPGDQAETEEAAEEEPESQTHATQTAAAAREVQETSYVTLGDPHLDAKLFPVHHPYGSGSLRADEGAGVLAITAAGGPSRGLLLQQVRVSARAHADLRGFAAP